MRMGTKPRIVRGREEVFAALGDLGFPDHVLHHLKDEIGDAHGVSMEIGEGSVKISGARKMRMNGGHPDFDIDDLHDMFGGDKKPEKKDGPTLAVRLGIFGNIAAAELLKYARNPEAEARLPMTSSFGRMITLAEKDGDRYHRLNERLGVYGVDLKRVFDKTRQVIESRSVSDAQVAVEEIGKMTPVLLRVMLDAADDAETATSDIMAI